MIYVLIPSRNEAATIGLLLWKVRQVFTAFSREYQLVVVDDASDDSSGEVLAPYARALPLTLLRHRKPLGYARSLEALFREALARTDRPRRDFAVTIQGDFSESPDDLPELIKRLEGGADIANGIRRPRRGGALASAMLGIAERVSRTGAAGDLTGTIRGYRLAVLDKLLREAGNRTLLAADGWAADAELLLRAMRHARKVEAVELTGAVPPGRRPSRVSAGAASWQVLRTAWAMRGERSLAPAAVEGELEQAEPVRVAMPQPEPAREERTGRGERGGRGERARGERRAQERGRERGRDRSRRERASVAEEPMTDGPMTDGPVTAEPVTAGPVTAGPVTEGPMADGPRTDGPVTEGSVTEGSERSGERTRKRGRRGRGRRNRAPQTGSQADAPAAQQEATADEPDSGEPGHDVPDSEGAAATQPARRRRRRGGRGRGRARNRPNPPQSPGDPAQSPSAA